MPKPLLTLVDGPAAGAGFSLAISSDVVLAGQSASFLAAYGGIGLTADGGLSWLLPRIAGLRQEKRIIHLKQKIGAGEAETLGLVTQCVPDGELAEAGHAMAQRLAASAMSSIAASGSLLLSRLQTDYATQIEAERRSMVAAARTPENDESIAAFTQKRKPDFQKAK